MCINKRILNWYKCLKTRKDKTESPHSSSKPQSAQSLHLKGFSARYRCHRLSPLGNSHCYCPLREAFGTIFSFFLIMFQKAEVLWKLLLYSEELAPLYISCHPLWRKNGGCRWQPAWLRPPIKEIKNLQVLWCVRCSTPHYYADGSICSRDETFRIVQEVFRMGNICSRDETFRTVQEVFQTLLQPRYRPHTESRWLHCALSYTETLISCHGVV